MIFWVSLVLSLFFWLIITIINLVTLNLFWFALAISNSILSGINFGSYMKCKGSHQNKLNSITNKLGFNIFVDEQEVSKN